MQNEQNYSSVRRFLFVILCVWTVVCMGWAAAGVVYYRRAMEAEKQAAVALDQQRLAELQAQQAEQRAVTAEQARDQVTFQLAYLKNVIGVESLSDAELAVVRPTISKDPSMQKLDAMIAADRVRIKEHFDPAHLVRDDYHTALNMACDVIRHYNKAFTELQEKNIQLIMERDKALLGRRRTE